MPTTTNTPMSQPRRALRAVAGSIRSRSASTGGIEPARRAGSTAAAIVTPSPTATTATIDPRLGSTRSNGIEPIVRRSIAISSARTNPATSPSAEPRIPSTPAWNPTKATSWRRVAPAARSSPSSRTLSETVIDSVLKIRNAPTNSATAAISAVVERKSAVEPRNDAATSLGDERT